MAAVFLHVGPSYWAVANGCQRLSTDQCTVAVSICWRAFANVHLLVPICQPPMWQCASGSAHSSNPNRDCPFANIDLRTGNAYVPWHVYKSFNWPSPHPSAIFHLSYACSRFVLAHLLPFICHCPLATINGQVPIAHPNLLRAIHV